MIVWAVSKELLDQRCVAAENIVLTDHALVRQFAGIDRELFVEKCKTQHALRAAACLRCQRLQFALQPRLSSVVVHNLRRGWNA